MSREQRAEAPAEEAAVMPFDPRTILLGLWKRRGTFAIVFLSLASLSFVSGLLFASRVFKAETVLIYQPTPTVREVTKEEEEQKLVTYLNLVEIYTNLAKVRERLSLRIALDELGEMVSAEIQPNTRVLSIKADWHSAKTSADIANTLREAFLEKAMAVRKAEAAKQIRDLEAQVTAITERLRAADQALYQYTEDKNLIDVEKESAWYLEELGRLDVMLEAAEVEQKTLRAQAENIKVMIAEVKKQIAAGQKDFNAGMVGPELQLKIERLRRSIAEESQNKVYGLEFEMKKKEYERAKHLYGKRVIPKVEFDTAESNYQKALAMIADTPQMKAYKDELTQLENSFVQMGGGITPATQMLSNLLLKEYEIRLAQAASKDKLEQYSSAKARIQEKIDAMPRINRQYVQLMREVKSGEEEKTQVEALLADARRAFRTDSAIFTVAADAQPPVRPSSSTRLLVTLGGTLLGGILALLLILTQELLDTRIKSARDLVRVTDLPVLASFPRLRGDVRSMPDKDPSDLVEPFRRLSLQTWARLPGKGSRLLVVNAGGEEGRRMVSANLASCFGLQEERVLLLDAQVRDPWGVDPVRDVLDHDSDLASQIPGLGDYLAGRAEIEDVVHMTRMPNVLAVPRSTDPVAPDMLGAQRMRELLEEAKKRFTLTLIDAPPILEYVDAELMARDCEGILLVLGSMKLPSNSIRRAIERLEKSGAPVLGIVLTGVDPLYFDEEWIILPGGSRVSGGLS